MEHYIEELNLVYDIIKSTNLVDVSTPCGCLLRAGEADFWFYPRTDEMPMFSISFFSPIYIMLSSVEYINNFDVSKYTNNDEYKFQINSTYDMTDIYANIRIGLMKMKIPGYWYAYRSLYEREEKIKIYRDFLASLS